MFLALVFLFLFPSGFSAYGQDAMPVPAQHPAVQLEKEKKETESRKAGLEKEAAQINKEMEDTKTALVDIAKEVKANEAELNTLEKRMADGQTEKKEIEGRLKKDRSSIGDLVLALERLDRTPPEAILARPGAPLETAQSAMLLQSILPGIYGRAENLKKDLNRLSDILAQLAKDQASVKTTAASLAVKQTEMIGLLKKRQALYSENQQGLKQEELALREISAKAESLKDLVGKISAREAEEERTRVANAAKAAANPELDDEPVRAALARPTPIPQTGSAQLPISGLIRMGYKQVDEIGAESQGLTIEGRAGSLVVSPMGGIVRYAGTFKNYGRIIIVEHQKDYHSLIAGLARIDTVVGQSVAAGEPVGSLPKSSPDGGKPTLYYELRLDGEPVNPARKFAGL